VAVRVVFVDQGQANGAVKEQKPKPEQEQEQKPEPIEVSAETTITKLTTSAETLQEFASPLTIHRWPQRRSRQRSPLALEIQKPDALQKPAPAAGPIKNEIKVIGH